jgi:hypothetical protein
MATLRASGHVGAGQLPHPFGRGFFLRGGALGLVDQDSALS